LEKQFASCLLILFKGWLSYLLLSWGQVRDFHFSLSEYWHTCQGTSQWLLSSATEVMIECGEHSNVHRCLSWASDSEMNLQVSTLRIWETPVPSLSLLKFEVDRWKRGTCFGQSFWILFLFRI
jgi:hypothetical protein